LLLIIKSFERKSFYIDFGAKTDLFEGIKRVKAVDIKTQIDTYTKSLIFDLKKGMTLKAEEW